MAEEEVITRYIAGLEVTVPSTDTMVYIYRVFEVEGDGQKVRSTEPEVVLGPITVEQAQHLSMQLANALTFVGFPDEAFLESGITAIRVEGEK